MRSLFEEYGQIILAVIFSLIFISAIFVTFYYAGTFFASSSDTTVTEQNLIDYYEKDNTSNPIKLKVESGFSFNKKIYNVEKENATNYYITVDKVVESQSEGQSTQDISALNDELAFRIKSLCSVTVDNAEKIKSAEFTWYKSTGVPNLSASGIYKSEFKVKTDKHQKKLIITLIIE